MLKHKKIHIIALAFLFLSSIATTGVAFSPQASATTVDPGGGTTPTTAAPGTLNINAGVSRINRMTLLMGTTYFYDSNTTDSDWTFKSIGLTCGATIKYSASQSAGHGSATPETWTLSYTMPQQTGGGCGAENTKSLGAPSNWSARQYVVFAGGSSDGQFISVKPDNGAVFKKGGTYNGDTVYIQQGVDPYSCPLVIVTNSRSTALIPLEKKDKESDVSNQIKTLFSKELNVSDTACGPTDNDKLGIFSQFGLPESYYNAGRLKDHYETTDFGFSGQNVGSATIYVATIAQAAGIAQNGPLKGGGYDGSTDTSAAETAGDATKTSCAVDGIGWIICPVMGFVAKVNDSAFAFLQSFLGIRPSLIKSDGAQNAWKAFRDIANVAFVIAFLVIVYSQLTSAGISNYGIKKMLPRIVIAAILVNLSYFICAIMVDLSNILGASIYSLLKGFDVGTSVSDPSWQSAVSGTNGILAKAASGIAIVLLAIAVFLAPTTLLAFAVIILILIARQAFVVLLLVISPLAFVAYLLPNTEDWFKRWWKALVATLMVYPIIGAVFGASTLAANILSSVKDSTSDDPSLMQLIALGVLAVPLFAVPALLKGSLSAAGSVGQKLAGLQDRANRRGLRGIKEGRIGEAKAAWDRSRQNNKFKRRTGNGRLATWGKNRDGVIGKSAAWIGTRQQAFDSSSVGSKLGGTRGAAVATQGIFKQYDEDVAAFKTTMSGKSNEALIEMIKNSNLSSEQRAAAAGMIMSRDHRESHLEALHAVGQAARAAEASNNTSELGTLSDIQKQMSHDMKDKPWALGDQAAGQLEEGVYGRSVNHDGKSQQQFGDINEEIKDRVGKKLSAASIAKMNPDEMNHIRDAALNNELDDAQLKKLKTSIEAARANPQMNDLIKSQEAEKHQAILDYIAKNHPSVAADSQSTSPPTPTPSAQGGNPPASGGASPLPPVDPDDNAGVL